MLAAVVALAVLACYCEARPRFDPIAQPSHSFSSYVVGGEDATPGEFPWQLSQQRLGSTWSHSCGASLLSERYALSAAHCVDGTAVAILRVVAGVHERTDANGIISNLASYKTHERYNNDVGTFANDIAILTLATPITANGGNIQFASLPDNNDEQFAGRTCVISGWGRTGATNVLPVVLQKASIGIVTTARCAQLLSSVNGATPTDNMVCLYDEANAIGSCNGDSGGPLNCNYPNVDSDRRVVAGVTSWGISSLGVCRQNYPSVYTRTSAYLNWIANNTP